MKLCNFFKQYKYRYLCLALIFMLFIILFLYFAFYNTKDNLEKNVKNDVSKDLNSKDIEKNKGELSTRSNDSSLLDISYKGDLTGAVSYYEEQFKKNQKPEVKEKLISAYLRYGSAYYKEEVYSSKALELLNNNEDNFFTLYYKGYANEIVEKYKEALEFYNQALKLENIEDLQKANLFNQKGHIYDLLGEKDLANKFYILSEDMGFNLPGNLINRGRYEYTVGNFDQAEKYFTQVLSLDILYITKAEMYYNLSNIYLNKKDGLDKAIEYSKLGIQANKNYPYNYLSLGIGYFYKGGSDFEKSLPNFKKVLEIYPNSSTAYKWIGVYYYTKDDFQKALESFKKQLEKSKYDITLMLDERNSSVNTAMYDIARSYALDGNLKGTIEYLNKLLNGENVYYYNMFLADVSMENGAFYKIYNNDDFKKTFSNILERHKK